MESSDYKGSDNQGSTTLVRFPTIMLSYFY